MKLTTAASTVTAVLGGLGMCVSMGIGPSLIAPVSVAAFSAPSHRAAISADRQGMRTQTALFSSTMKPPSSSSSSSSSSPDDPEHDGNNSHDNAEDIKRDIAAMRKEAVERLEALSDQVHELHLHEDEEIIDRIKAPRSAESQLEDMRASWASLDSSSKNKAKPSSKAAPKAASKTRITTKTNTNDKTAQNIVDMLDKTTPLGHAPVGKTKTMTKLDAKAERLTRLDNTRWRLSLDVGREQGTWMPKTWGASGERLRLFLEIEFSDNPLMEWEDFLNGSKGSKTLKVVNHCLNSAPSMNEGSLTIDVSDGGWRIAPGEGPYGTDLLRFYFDVNQETHHTGSDVYCPEGRVFFTCGYFPHKHDINDGSGFATSPQCSVKDQITKKQHQLGIDYEKLEREQSSDDAPFYNWDKIRRTKRLMEMRGESQKLEKKMQEAKTREPQKSLLRLSQDQEVGLTREGGACCKVHRGLAIEYHILGHFEVASIPNRDHSHYKELLP
mmetsp:Transcript_5126/g.13770  ORF Transcript_5126/g.13770 Transcript_5126/m.13770 type:complete len:497 (-) Transcript_5126:1342-2832(-)|eukprot:CAMPEP_0198112528 /NCGR_PEP_ID=MMETSP1442-20131203/4369_1 /TAXON_ID= /ORGANISM="Craspedostauros australis, Strain CCMP3328" /LENGTH=496 /DNA_ID=CAMNT_0043769337 /DNA_START=92 /DNA_END=1582 /DNA_ORIENTATION=-